MRTPNTSDLQHAACILTVLADMTNYRRLAEQLRYLAIGLLPESTNPQWHPEALRDWAKELGYAFEPKGSA